MDTETTVKGRHQVCYIKCYLSPHVCESIYQACRVTFTSEAKFISRESMLLATSQKKINAGCWKRSNV